MEKTYSVLVWTGKLGVYRFEIKTDDFSKIPNRVYDKFVLDNIRIVPPVIIVNVELIHPHQYFGGVRNPVTGEVINPATGEPIVDNSSK